MTRFIPTESIDIDRLYKEIGSVTYTIQDFEKDSGLSKVRNYKSQKYILESTLFKIVEFINKREKNGFVTRRIKKLSIKDLLK